MRNQTTKLPLTAICACLFAVAIFASISSAQSVNKSNPLRTGDSAGEQLTTKQSRLADRYDQLEMLAGRLAELSRATQPRRARLLRELVAKSRERDIPGRFNTIVEALQVESLGKASNAQGELQVDLQKLLDLLLQEDRDKQIESERKRIRKYLAELKQLIQRQRGIKARTDGGDDAKPLTDDQRKLSESTQKLEQEIKANEIAPNESNTTGDDSADENQESDTDANSDLQDSRDSKPKSDGNKAQGKPSDRSDPKDGSDSNSPPTNDDKRPEQDSRDSPNPEGKESQNGQPSDSQPSQGQPSQGQSPSTEENDQQSPQSQSPAQRAQQRLQRAQERMQQALEDLEKANRDNAVQRQQEALRELEQAKAELERILRQLREEERERMLVMLEARFRKMLDAQTIVYEQTKKLDSSRESVPEHEVEIASGRLSRQEREIVREADRALVLLREDGTTVAFPEALEQAREDMISVQERLSDVKTAAITQGLEEDIIAALEETLAALQQAIKKAREQKGQPQQSTGSPGEQELIDQLAELRMIRALQNRVNRRTQRYGEIIGDQITADPDLLEALDELALRQERIFQATRDLDTGRNQ